jgi:hypothetical protein
MAKHNLYDKLIDHFMELPSNVEKSHQDLVERRISIRQHSRNDIEPDLIEHCSELLTQASCDADIWISKSNLTSTELMDMMSFEGPDPLQQKCRDLILEFIDIFGTTVSATPMLVTPMTLNEDESKWKCVRTEQAPRHMIPAKEQSLRTQVEEFLQVDVIRHSRARAYSHPHMVLKPPDEYRFCLDYRYLNECMVDIEGYRIPLIQNIFEHIGTKNPMFFAKLDMTAGYYQAPLAEEAK